MYVQRFFGVFMECFHHGEAEGYVGNESAVHHVHVEEVGFATVDTFDFALEVAKVGTEDGGCDGAHKVRDLAGYRIVRSVAEAWSATRGKVFDGAFGDVIIALEEREEAFVAEYVADDIGIDEALDERS